MTLWFGLATILAAEIFLFIDVIARSWAVVPEEALVRPSNSLESVARWIAINMTAICWTALLFVLDGVLAWNRRLDGTIAHSGSPVRKRPRRFVLCFLASIAIWLSFDGINFGALRAWEYHGLPESTVHRLAGYFLAFGAICPAVFLMADAGRRFGLGCLAGRPLRMPARAEPYLIGVGAAFLAFPLIVRDSVGTLTLWLGWILLLDPINRRLGAPSLLADWAAGRWGRTVTLMAAGLVCGLLWEFWNYWAVAKWTYDLAFLGPLEGIRYFEMPALGMVGFVPFALECWVMFQTIVLLLDRVGLSLAEPLPDEEAVI